MSDCVFCKIIAGEIPSEKVYEDDEILMFHDINKSAPVHILCVPKIHIDSLNDLNLNHENIKYAARILEKIPEIAKSFGISGGYRVITNIGEDGGQSVKHLHFHVIGGRKLGYLG
ncbi:MAG: histidine triad nucleotide-binding protein [Oscillospiraceae bacterium]|nr:histidine triad nucleotide-binding protein [Oscillospiraceae bacterium]